MRVILISLFFYLNKPVGRPWCWFPKIWIWEVSTPFAYDGSTEVMRALAEVTVIAEVGAFVAQPVSRAGALVSVLHAETEL